MARRVPPSWIFAVLAASYSVLTNGVAGTLLSYLLRQQGVTVDNVASEIALISVPGTLFVLWSPLTDFWLRRRTWFFLCAALAAVCVTVAFRLKSYASPLAVALLTFAFAVVTMSIAALVPESRKVHTASLLQTGNLAGGALGAGGLLALAQHISRQNLGLVAGLLIAVPALLVFFIDEPELRRHQETFLQQLSGIGREFKHTFLKWAAVPALLLLISPMGSGAAIGIFSSIAADYHVTENQVAWMNGLAGGLLTALGAMLMALLPASIDTRIAYPVAGLVNALVLSVMLFGTPRPWMYLWGAGLYLFSIGAAYALYSLLVLNIVGDAGRSGSARYAISVSLANLPVVYMASIDGLGARLFGPKGLPGADMAVSTLAACAFLLYFYRTRKRSIALPLALPPEPEPTPSGGA